MRREYLICGLLAILTLALYAPALDDQFINYDDQVYVTTNAHVQQGLTWENIGWSFRSSESYNWHPLTWLSHLLDCQLFGLKPWGHHLTSVLLHAANTAMLYLLLWRMTGAVARSIFVAAFFGWHPLHVESAAWVAERKDVLSTFFWMLTMLAYARYARGFKVPGSKFKVYYGLALFCFALGLMCKPMLVTAPFVLLLLDYWPLGRMGDLRFTIYEPDLKDAPREARPGMAQAPPLQRRSKIVKLILEKAPFFLLAAAISAITYVIQKNEGAMPSDIPPGARAGNALVSYCRYIGKLVCPVDLAVYYPHPGYWPTQTVIPAALLLLGITVLTVAMRNRHPYMLVGWLWFMGTLVPTIGLVQVGRQSMADRYMYVPAIGLFIILIWGAAEMATMRPQWKWGLSAAGACLLAACLILTSRQLAFWKNSETLNRHALMVTRDNDVANANLGNYLVEQKGEIGEGIGYLEEALRINPAYTDAYESLGYARCQQGKLDDAFQAYLKADKLAPEYPEIHYNLGRLLTKRNEFAQAVDQLRKALQLRPHWPLALMALGDAHGAQGDLKSGIAEYMEAAQLDPKNASARINLAGLLAQDGEPTKAVAHYREAIRLEPNSLEALNNLAWLFATERDPQIRDGREAVQLAKKGCGLSGNQMPALMGTLAAAYAEAGQFKEAVEAGTKAHDLAESKGMKELAQRNEELLKLYRAHRPFHGPAKPPQPEGNPSASQSGGNVQGPGPDAQTQK